MPLIFAFNIQKNLANNKRLKDGTFTIANYAFYGCSSLDSITIPNSVTSIGFMAFRNCLSLEKIVVEENNHTYHSEGNCLIETDTKTLIAGCKTSVIPSDGSVTSIGDDAFQWCTSLTSITIPDSVTSIGSGAFYYCTSLKTVYYEGTTSQWKNIIINTRNEALLYADITYKPNAPEAPTLAFEGDGMVVLDSADGFEYSLDGVNWQSSNIFTGLLPNTAYTFYCRVAQTENESASDISEGLNITTSDFYYELPKPDAPVVQSVTDTTVTLVMVDGVEYSMDGSTWQLSNVFTGLAPNTQYSFYCRFIDISLSDISAATVITTLKSTVSAPASPKLAYAGNGMVILNTTSGCEYSRDGINWQSSNVFEGLKPNKTYTFYCRIPETDTTYAAVSEGLVVTTGNFTYSPDGDTNCDGNMTAADAVYLMNHVLLGNADYPVSMDCDFDGDGVLTEDDATYLLYHTLFGDLYPLS